MKINLVCVKCKEPHLTRKATTQWNPKTGAWEISKLNDVIWCYICGEEVGVYEEEYFEFKPCPFCGEKNHISFFQENYYHYISCQECESRGPDSYMKEEAKLLWNTRKNEEV